MKAGEPGLCRGEIAGLAFGQFVQGAIPAASSHGNNIMSMNIIDNQQQSGLCGRSAQSWAVQRHSTAPDFLVTTLMTAAGSTGEWKGPIREWGR